MTTAEWILILIAALIVLAFFERIAFVVFAIVMLTVKIVDILIGGVIGNRRT